MEIDNENLRRYVLSSLYLNKNSLAREFSEASVEDFIDMKYVMGRLKKFIADYEFFCELDKKVKGKGNGDKQ